MKFVVNRKLFEEFVGLRIGVSVANGVNNKVDAAAFLPQLQQAAADAAEACAGQPVAQLPKIAAWREAYRKFGVKAKEYPSSVEALYKRVSKGKELGSISPLVDIYNYISLKYTVPVGGEDLSAMQGDLQLTYAGSGEVPVVVLGKDEAQAPAEGEIFYKDDAGAICRRWNWREVARTVITENTVRCVFVIEALPEVGDEELRAAQQELGALIEQYCGGKLVHHVLDAGCAEVPLD
ncbi:B3/4 domain-containing protein [Eikenella sp. Marseille-P7795]|uniref:B3/B4 domain-containing protein n=1 Tax=Eikenella sp. Marseille-P7795 TaxID=2866577 RepID=UPI001CE4571A|nr:phenylalanine--tRNA ligase beta subunit-related protein [Eikenella sp. Marseille-P7795]